MNKIKNFARKLWTDESGQGTAEYVLLAAVVVGALAIFGPKIKKAIIDKTDEVTGKMGSIGNE